MQYLKKGLVACLLLVVSTAVLAKPTVEDLFKNAAYTSVTVSPNGKYLAAIAPANDRRNIAIIDLEDRSKSKFITGLEDQDVAGYTWVTNDRILFGIDADGAEAVAMYAVDRKGGRIKTLIDPFADIDGVPTSGMPTPGILDTLEDDERHILVSYDKRRVGSPDVYKVNIKNGGMKMVERNPGTVSGWITDHDGKIRGAVAQDKLMVETWYRDTEEDEWTVVDRYNWDDPNGISPLFFDYDNEHWFVGSNQGENTSGIYRYNPKTKELGDLIFRHEEVDAGGLMMSEKYEKVLAATYYTSKPQWVGIDEEFTAMMTGLENAFPDKVVSIASRDKAENLMVISTSSDTDPGGYFLFNREKAALEPLVDRMPWIDPSQMTEMKAISYTARDGMKIHGYLTLPKGSDGKDLPLIVNPHGGPWARDFWGFNQEHQFFASRGYAVLQMNFRGSTGYGREHLEAGYKQWGRTMQDDISDGVKWAVEEGIANEDRVCIYGASYGGYATMAGMTFTPELYKCGVNYVGVTDVALLFETMPKRWNLAAEQMKMQVGDPDTEEEFLEAISPVNHVENIQAPIFIVHGRKDPRVSMKHADRLRDEMEKHNKPYEWLVKNNEGHGFSKQENRIELYTKMEQFFEKHIGSSGP
ncbi:MAG: S9 family peptidase [Pseudomonadota bacterium]